MNNETLVAGERLGPYAIVGRIGQGGMGEVYLAEDTALHRRVALKVLPLRYSADKNRRERMTREGRALASLNHRNIATLHGVEYVGAAPVLVMEFVEGPTLAERLHGDLPLTLDEVRRIGDQIIDALDAAHSQGLVHRDLKPDNIKIRPDGAIKLLDFGLAKAYASATISRHGEDTITLADSGATIVGTSAYMSPEQTRGIDVDARADIWAFGCVLFEMLSQRQAFQGATTSDTIAAVLERDPDWRVLPSWTPAGIRRLLRRCLEKDPNRRLRHIVDARPDLEESSTASPDVPLTGGAGLMRRAWASAPGFAMGALAAAAALLGAELFRSQPEADAAVEQFALASPSIAPMHVGPGRSVAIARDGSRLVVRSDRGSWGIRRRDQLAVAKVGGGGVFLEQPAFSPDGHWVAFVAGGPGDFSLVRVPARGGVHVPIVSSVEQVLGVTWMPDETIIFARPSGLHRVSQEGGPPTLLAAADPAGGEFLAWPESLPGGRWILFTATRRGTTVPGRFGEGTVAALNLQTGERRTILPGASHARYISTGHLVYTVGTTMYAVPFDAAALAVHGDPVAVLDDVKGDDFATADDGTLVYVSGSDENRQLVWVDRAGREEAINAPARHYIYPSVSPDGTKVAIDIGGADRNIWIWNVVAETLSRLTFEPGEDLMPIWAPDGERIAYGRRAGEARLFWQRVDGNGAPHALMETSTGSQLPNFFTPDGSRLVYTEQGRDLLAVSLNGRAPVEPLVTSGAREFNGAISADGRWIAYASDETGQFEVFVRPMDAGSREKSQISRAGGTQPVWSRDGRELFFRDTNGALFAATVQLTAGFRAERVTRLFESPRYSGSGGVIQARTYDVSPDGKRFLMIKHAAARDDLPANNSLILVQNWFADIRRRAPAHQ